MPSGFSFSPAPSHIMGTNQQSVSFFTVKTACAMTEWTGETEILPLYKRRSLG